MAITTTPPATEADLPALPEPKWTPPAPVLFDYDKRRMPEKYAAYTIGQLHEAFRAGFDRASRTPPAAVPDGGRELILAMCRDAQELARIYGLALHAIATLPLPEQDNMLAFNMRQIAADALMRALGTEPHPAIPESSPDAMPPWKLCAPDGRVWTGDGYMQVCSKAQRDCIDPVVAMDRIRTAMAEPDALETAAAAALDVWHAITTEAECVIVGGDKRLVLTSQMADRLAAALEAVCSPDGAMGGVK